MAACACGLAISGPDSGLLRALLQMLTDPHAIGMAPGIARAVLTVLSAITLAVMLWALMFAVSTDGEDVRERRLTMVIAFGWTLLMIAFATLISAVDGRAMTVPNLFAMQMATLLSMLAAAGVEYGWEARLLASEPENENAVLAKRMTSRMAITSARLAAMAESTGNRKAN